MDKEDVVYIYNGVLLGNQKNEILPFATIWMELEGIMLSEIRERQIYVSTHRSTLRHRTDEQRERKQK